MNHSWREDFPILKQEVYGRPLVYLDNAATMQVPQQVLSRVLKYYTSEHANVHRGVHFLSKRSTYAMEQAREKASGFLHAPQTGTIVFTQGTTDSIHLVSSGMRGRLDQKHGVLTTELEHHSNYVPWQQLCMEKGAPFCVCPSHDGVLDLNEMEMLLRKNPICLVAAAHVSNLTGTVNPILEITELAHRYGARVLVDGAQGILHRGVDVAETDCDYYCFSGHKMLAMTGIGVLYGKKECMEDLQPVRSGGGMVDLVTEGETTFLDLPLRMEAGTPNIAGIISLGAAIDYLQDKGIEKIRQYEDELITHTLKKLSCVSGIRILGNPKLRSGAVSFAADGVQPYDMAQMLDKLGYAVRSGNHCAQPALHSLGEEKAVRISPAFYNTMEEIDQFCAALSGVVRMLKGSTSFRQPVHSKY